MSETRGEVWSRDDSGTAISEADRVRLRAEREDMCRNGHPFEPGVTVGMEAERRAPSPDWCDVCGADRDPDELADDPGTTHWSVNPSQAEAERWVAVVAERRRGAATSAQTGPQVPIVGSAESDAANGGEAP